jgi:hypothetical protein
VAEGEWRHRSPNLLATGQATAYRKETTNPYGKKTCIQKKQKGSGSACEPKSKRPLTDFKECKSDKAQSA